MMKTASSRLLLPAIWVAVIMLAVLYLGSSLRVISDISQFMPRFEDGQQKLSLVMAELEQGQTGRILFIRLKSSSEKTTAESSRLLRQCMLESGLFDTVDNGEHSTNMDDFQRLFEYRYLINTRLDPEDFSRAGIHRALLERVAELRSGMGLLLKQTLAADPINGFADYLQAARLAGGPEKHLGVWFSPDREQALLVATIGQEGFDIDKQEDAVGFVRTAFADLDASGDASLEITGPGSFAVAARSGIQQTLRALSVVAASLIVMLLFVVYRSFTLVLLAGVPIVSAILVSIAVTNLAYGYVHGITLAFGITLLGICIDYPVHFFSHLRDDWPVGVTLEQILPTMRLGLATTALGYLVLVLSGFEGLEQLAIFAVAGLATALAVTRWVLPSMVRNTMAARGQRIRRCNPFGGHTGARYTALVLLLVISAGTVWHASRHDGIWQKDISALSPVPAQDRALDREIRTQLGAAEVNHVFILADRDVQTLLQQTEQLAAALQQLEAEGLADSVRAPTDLLPSESRQRANQQALPRRGELASRVEQAVAGTPFKQAIFSQFIDDVQLQAGLKALTPEAIGNTPLGRMIGSDLFHRSGTWIAVIRLSGVDDEAALTAWLERQPELARNYLNLKQQTSRLLASYAGNVVFWLVIGMGLMLLVLALYLRSKGSAMRIMLAPMAAVLISLGSTILLHGEINLFHLMSVLLIIGLGIDYSLFLNRHSSDAADRYNSCHGVFVSAFSTLVAFGVLMFSDVPVLLAIGQTVAIGVVAGLLLALLLADPDKSRPAPAADSTPT